MKLNKIIILSLVFSICTICLVSKADATTRAYKKIKIEKQLSQNNLNEIPSLAVPSCLKPIMRDLRNIFNRAGLLNREVTILRGICRRILRPSGWKKN